MSEIDYDLIFDKVLEKKIKNPNVPEDEREIAKALLSYSPYREEKKRKKKTKTVRKTR